MQHSLQSCSFAAPSRYLRFSSKKASGLQMNVADLSTSPFLWHNLLFDTCMRHSCGTGQDLSGRRRSVPSLRCQATSQHNSDNADRFKEAAAQSTSAYHQRPVPWAITFDIRERETIWTDENKVRQPSFTTGKSSAVQSPCL